jgi:hypothetical protein
MKRHACIAYRRGDSYNDFDGLLGHINQNHGRRSSWSWSWSSWSMALLNLPDERQTFFHCSPRSDLLVIGYWCMVFTFLAGREVEH